MARLEAESKMGFYATPEEVVKKIKEMLQIPEGSRLLDPCCGEGDALSQIAEGTGAETFGVELDRGRFECAREKLDNVLWADALNEVKISKNSFGLLFLNPPYDYDYDPLSGEVERLEVKFMRKYFPALQDKGVLILIVPFNILDKFAEFSGKLKDLRVFLFPEGESRFRQVVLFAIKQRVSRSEASKNAEVLNRSSMCTYYWDLGVPIIIHVDDITYTVPPSDGEVVFKSRKFDPHEAVSKVKGSPAWKKFQALIALKDRDTISPLTPLREGHLALLLASGIMNGEVKANGRRMIIKGVVDQKEEKIEEEEGDKTRKTRWVTRYAIKIRAILPDELEPKVITIQ